MLGLQFVKGIWSKTKMGKTKKSILVQFIYYICLSIKKISMYLTCSFSNCANSSLAKLIQITTFSRNWILLFCSVFSGGLIANCLIKCRVFSILKWRNIFNSPSFVCLLIYIFWRTPFKAKFMHSILHPHWVYVSDPAEISFFQSIYPAFQPSIFPIRNIQLRN